MLLLPATVTVVEALDTQRVLTEALRREADPVVVVDASNLKQFDSSALAVLLECERLATAQAKTFSVRGAPPKLVALARLYGIEALVPMESPPTDRSMAA